MTKPTPGAGLGRVLAQVLGDTIIHASAATADHQSAARIRGMSDFMELGEDAIAPLLKATVEKLLDDPDLPDSQRLMLRYLAAPEHQWGVVIEVIGFAFAILPVLMGLGQIEAQGTLNKVNEQFTPGLISPADLAEMVMRGIVDSVWAEGEAAKNGLSGERFNLLVQDVGEPYGIDQALSLYRRGLISETELQKVVFYSRVRDDFFGDLLLLAHDTMTGGDAIEVALKQIADIPTAQALFGQAGGLESQFQMLLDAAGNSIGIEQALNLWNHKLIDEAEVTKIIAHSRINPLFYDDAKLLRHRWLSVIQIEIGLKAGTVSAAAATEWLTEDGYPADQIAAFVQGAAAAKVATHKQLTEAQITELFYAGIFTHDQADAELQSLGYDPGETGFILSVYEQRHLLAMAQAAIGQVRKVFLAHRIDDAAATAQLASLGVDPTSAAQYVRIWTIEAASELKELTMAQIGSAFKKGLLTAAEAVARWETMGYSAPDAGILLAIYGGPPPAGSPAAVAPVVG